MPCAGFPLVLEGEIQVSRNSGDGRRLELYRVMPGEVCIVSTAGLLSRRPLSAQGSAVLRTRLAMLSPALFDQWNNHPPFRHFVFGVFADRLGDLMAVVDALAFHRLDERLADYLLGHGRVIHTTHQELADELGTVREIITRLLKRFAAAGAVKLGRERIEVIDAIALRALAAGVAR
jgi:CRP/FNR family transcriptional regulator